MQAHPAFITLCCGASNVWVEAPFNGSFRKHHRRASDDAASHIKAKQGKQAIEAEAALRCRFCFPGETCGLLLAVHGHSIAPCLNLRDSRRDEPWLAHSVPSVYSAAKELLHT